MRRLLPACFFACVCFASLANAEDATPDPTKVFLIVDQQDRVKGKATFAPMAKNMLEDLTKERPTTPERPAFGGFTPIKGDSAKTMLADAIKAEAGLILHVNMLDSARDGSKRTTLNAQYTIYEPKKDASPDKPVQYWAKGPTEKLKSTAPEVDPDTLGGKIAAGQSPHDAYQLMAVDIRAALVKRVATIKGLEGKVDKGTLTITAIVTNVSKLPIATVTLSLPHEDYVKYVQVREELRPGDTKKVTFKITDSAASKMIWKNAKLSEVFVVRAGAKKEPKE